MQKSFAARLNGPAHEHFGRRNTSIDRDEVAGFTLNNSRSLFTGPAQVFCLRRREPFRARRRKQELGTLGGIDAAAFFTYPRPFLLGEGHDARHRLTRGWPCAAFAYRKE